MAEAWRVGRAVEREEGKTDHRLFVDSLKGQSYWFSGPYFSLGCQIPSKEKLPYLCFDLFLFYICNTQGPSQGCLGDKNSLADLRGNKAYSWSHRTLNPFISPVWALSASPKLCSPFSPTPPLPSHSHGGLSSPEDSWFGCYCHWATQAPRPWGSGRGRRADLILQRYKRMPRRIVLRGWL